MTLSPDSIIAILMILTVAIIVTVALVDRD